MKIKTPDYYKDFKCIGGTCIDTCCAGWEVDVDKKKSEYYKSVEGEFGDKLRKMLIDCPIEDRFVLQENGRCPFLNADNLCDIYINLGEDKLCETCTNFPRHITEFGNTREIGISLSCPVSVELIMSREKKIEFETTENDEKITLYNDIDANLYFNLCKARNKLYDICQNRSIAINHRAAIALDFAKHIQKNIKNHSKTDEIIAAYSGSDYVNVRLTKLKKYKKNTRKNLISLFKWLEVYEKELEHIKPEWQNVLNDTSNLLKSLDESSTDKAKNISADFFLNANVAEYEYEHLLIYYIYRYFLCSVFDNEAYNKMALGIVALIFQVTNSKALYIKQGSFSFNNQITLMRLYSKETEHSEENLEVLYNHIKNNKNFSFKSLISLLLGDDIFNETTT